MRCWDGNSFSNLYIFFIYDIELIALEIAAPIDAGEEEKRMPQAKYHRPSLLKGLGVNRKAKKNTRWNCPFWVQLGSDVYIHI